MPQCESRTVIEMANDTLRLLRFSSYLHEESQVNGTFFVKLGVLLFGSHIIKYRRPVCDREMISNINDVIQRISSVAGVTLDHIHPEAIYRGKPLAVLDLMEVILTFVVYCTQAELLEFGDSDLNVSDEILHQYRQSNNYCENVESFHLPTSPEVPRSAGRPSVLKSMHQRKSLGHTNSGDKNNTCCEQVSFASRNDVLYPVTSVCSRDTLTPCGNIHKRHLNRWHSEDSPPATPQATDDILELEKDNSELHSLPSLQSSPVLNSPIHESADVISQRKIDLITTNDDLARSGQQRSPYYKTNSHTVCTNQPTSPTEQNLKISSSLSSGRGHSLTTSTCTVPTDQLPPSLSITSLPATHGFGLRNESVISEHSSGYNAGAQLSGKGYEQRKSPCITHNRPTVCATLAHASPPYGNRQTSCSSSSGRGDSPTTTTCTATMPTDQLPTSLSTSPIEIQNDSVISEHSDGDNSAAQSSTVSGNAINETPEGSDCNHNSGDDDDDTRTSSILAWSFGAEELSQPRDCSRSASTGMPGNSDTVSFRNPYASCWATEAECRPSSCPGGYRSEGGLRHWEHRYGTAISTASVLLARTEGFSLALKRRLDHLRTECNRTKEEAEAVSRLVCSLVSHRNHTTYAEQHTGNNSQLVAAPTVQHQDETKSPTAMCSVIRDMLQEVLSGVNTLLHRHGSNKSVFESSKSSAWELEYQDLMRMRDRLMLDALSVLETVLKTQPPQVLEPVKPIRTLRTPEWTPSLQIGA